MKRYFILSILMLVINFMYSQNIDNTMEAYWMFENNGADSSMKAHHGTITNGTFVDDRFGNANSALILNGSSSSIDISDSYNLSSDTSITVSFWVNSSFTPTSGSPYSFYFLDIKNNSNTSRLTVVWRPNYSGDPYLEVGFNSSGTYGTTAPIDLSQSANQWQMITIGLDFTTDSIHYYLNDNLLYSYQLNSSLNFSFESPSTGRIGARYNNTYHNPMIIDDFRIYNRLLSLNEIDSLYNIQTNSNCLSSVNSISVNVCDSYESPSGNYLWSTSGIYYDTLQNIQGCDSILIISLFIDDRSIYYVDTAGIDTNNGSLTFPLRNIQTAIDRACDGDTIIVNEGTYYENIEVVSNDLFITSNFIYTNDSNTIVNTIINGDSIARVVELNNFNGTLQGFTIENGLSVYGAGVYLHSSVNPVIRYCHIQNNVGNGDITGHGISFEASEGILENCKIRYNYGRKWTVVISGNSVFRNSEVYNNTAWEESNVVVGGNAELYNLIIHDNIGGGLLIAPTSYQIVLQNLTITNNQLYGIWCRYNSTNCVLLNSIVWGNSNNNIFINQDANPIHLFVDYCDIEGGESAINATSPFTHLVYGENNINQSPMFNPSTIYELSSNSPCIGSGKEDISLNNQILSIPSEDFKGQSRPSPISSHPDIGAQESVIGNIYLFPDDSIITCQSTITIQPNLNYNNYLWDTGDTTSILTVTYSNWYTCTVSNNTDTIVDSVFVLLNTFPHKTLNINVCDSFSSPSGNYIWYSTGTYLDTIANIQGCDTLITISLHVDNQSIYYVDTLGDDLNTGSILSPLRNIQTAIDRACDGDTIIVNNGRYYENIEVISKDLYITSDYIFTNDTNSIVNTIIDGDSITNVVELSDFNGTLQGFTIENGLSVYGAGVYLHSSFNPVIRYCHIQNNVGNGDITGHGISFEASEGILENCKIRYNYGRKHTVIIGGNSSFKNSSVYSNIAWEESNVVVNSSSTLSNLLIYNNTGGGLKIWPGASGANISNLTIVNNTNFGLWLWGLNTSYNTIGAIHNSIIWGNSNHNVKIDQSNIPAVSKLYIDHCIVEGGDSAVITDQFNQLYYGNNNFNKDPLLDLNSFTLSPYSYAIGNGNDSLFLNGQLQSQDSFDYYYNPRPNPFGSNPDIGAVESSLAVPDCNIIGLFDADTIYLCNSESTISVDTGYVYYFWNNGSTLQNTQVDSTGWYYCTSQIGACSITDSVYVHIYPFVNIIEADTVSACHQQYIELVSIAGLIDYEWSSGDTTQNMFAQSTSQYFLTATDSFGCTIIDSIYVSLIHNSIQQNDTTICYGDTVILSVDTSLQVLNSNMPASLQNGLVAWYPFNGNANDESGNGHDGTVNGATLTTNRNGIIDNAYSYDNVNDIISTTNVVGVGQVNLTFSFWAKGLSNNFDMEVISQDCGSDCNNAYRLVLNKFLNSAIVCPYGHMGTSPPSFAYHQSAHYGSVNHTTLNEWSHYVLIVGDNNNYSFNNFKFYINGVEQTTDCDHNWGGWSMDFPNYPLIIGGNNFIGAIDDVGIWNRSLYEQEIQQLYLYNPEPFLWSTGNSSDTISVSPTETTTYYLTVSDGVSNCLDSITIQVYPTANIIEEDTIVGCQQEVFEISTIAGFSDYQWNTGDTTSIISVNGTGTYTVQAIDSVGCYSNDQVFVDLLTIDLPNDTFICEGNMVTLCAFGTGNIEWANGYNNYESITPSQTNYFPVTLSDGIGVCTDSLFVEVFPNPSFSFPYDTIALCNEDSVVLEVDGWNNYVWNTGLQNSPLTVENSGIYSVIIADSNICITRDTVVVSLINTNLMVSSQNICFGSSVNLEVENGYSYLWSTGETTSSIISYPTQSSIYSVTVSDGFSTCFESSYVTVSNPQFEFVDNTIYSCPNIDVEINAGIGWDSYNWSNGNTTENITVNEAGYYTLTVTDSINCQVSDTIEVVYWDSIPKSYNITNESCAGCNDGIIELILSYGNTAPYAVNWSTGETTATISNLSAGTYYVTLTDSYGCLDVDSITVIVPPDWNYQITSTNHSILIQGNTIFNLDGNSIDYGDYIGVFYDSSGIHKCGGYIIWEGTTNAITAWGDDASTTYKDGFSSSEEFVWRIWDVSAGISYDVEPVYDMSFPNQGTFITNGLSGIISLNSILNNLPWSYNLSVSNHTILIQDTIDITINGYSIDNGDYIGVFYDSLGTLKCGGYQEWTGVNTVVTAWGAESGIMNGFADGEEFKWKIWDSSENTEYSALATYLPIPPMSNQEFYSANGLSGLASLSSFNEQVIPLVSDWSYFSTYIDPVDDSISNILEDIITNVIIVKDYLGGVYWHTYGVDLIGEMSNCQGYQIKMASVDTLVIQGVIIQPELTDCILPPDWYIIPYLRTTPAPIELMLSSISQEIIIVKNSLGAAYWPAYGVNLIGDLISGEGYHIKTSGQCQLTYPANSIQYSKSNDVSTHMSHSVRNTGSNMTVMLPDYTWGVKPEEGSIINAYSSTWLKVGESIYQGKNTPITIWGDDELTDEVDGLAQDEKFIFKIQSQEGVETTIEVEAWLEGDEFYKTNKISVVDRMTIPNIQPFTINPNPFNDYLSLEILISTDNPIDIKVYNTIGVLIYETSISNGKIGQVREINLNQYGSGSYFYQIIIDETPYTGKLIKL